VWDQKQRPGTGQPCFLSSSIQDYHQLCNNDEFARKAWQIMGQTLGLVFWIFLCNFVESLAFLQDNHNVDHLVRLQLPMKSNNFTWILCRASVAFECFSHKICRTFTAFAALRPPLPLKTVATKVSLLPTSRGSCAPSTAFLPRHPQPFLSPSCLSSCYPLKPSLACSRWWV